MKSYLISFIFLLLLNNSIFAQPDRWQQKVSYVMNVDVDVDKNILTGKQKITYTNNSLEVLSKVYFHLFWNAFQPNSSMDVRSRELGKKSIGGNPDWDSRVKDRILNLKESEQGYQKIMSLKMNGIAQPFTYYETILQVNIKTPISPKSTVVFDVEFEAQVPLQIRRSGRDNPQTGVRYSMSQWYPKVCEYDYEGWHPTPYVAREFHGVWGDFDVTILIDKNYKLGGTGVLVNATEVGWGYDVPNSALKPTATNKRKWQFVGKNVHDFVWAADPDYKHLTRKLPGRNIQLHVIYKYVAGDKVNDSSWNAILDIVEKVFPYIEKKFGKYPYPQYSFIHGGDGGMEYAMATLIKGPGFGTVMHELMHSWYQMVLANNESAHSWMDEGFTGFAESLVTAYYYNKSSSAIYKDAFKKNPNNRRLKELIDKIPDEHVDAYLSYFDLANSGLEEPLTTYADHFNTNFAFSAASYSKGQVFVEQLGYIIGADTRDKTLLEYYKQWSFKHPNPNDFIRVAENVSGIQLDWYDQYWCKTTKTIDYAIDSLWEENGVSKIRISRLGMMPMPIDLQLTFKDGSTEMHYVPLNLMYGEKPTENAAQYRVVHAPWRWTHPTYTVEIKKKLIDLKIAEIDPTKRMADIDRKNNFIEIGW
jgi:hypothetical protein